MICIPKKMQDMDEAEETLSLCDLPMYSDSANHEDLSRESSQGSSSSSSSPYDQDYFEFFSEEWSSTLTSTNTSDHPESIIFCGKLIPTKEQTAPENAQNQEIKHQKEDQKRRGKNRIFRWKSFSFYESKKLERKASGKNGTTNPCMERKQPKIRENFNCKSLPLPSKSSKDMDKSGDFDKGYNFPVHKMSIFSSSSSSSGKSRWYLILSGISKFPSYEIEWRNIKNRQSCRQSCSSPMFNMKSGDEKNATMSGNRGLWSLLRALSCGGSHRMNAVAEASVGWIPPSL